MAKNENNDNVPKIEKKEKMYRVIIHNQELRKKNGKYECYVNGKFHSIPENSPVNLPPEVISHLETHRGRYTMPTGEDGAVDMTEGYSIEVKKSFEVIEV